MRILILFTLLISINLFAQDKGKILGTISNKETQQPVAGAIIEVIELKNRTATDSIGKFEFENIPYETYQLKITCIGYEALIKTDIVVLSSRPTNVTVELLPSNITTDVIDVEGKYFQKSTDESTSIYNLDFEEIRPRTRCS